MSPWLSCLHFAYISCMWQNKLDFCFCLCFCYAFSMVLESFSAPYNDRMQIFTKTKDRRAQPVVKYKKSIWHCVNISGRLSPFARQIQDFPEGANLKRGYQTIIQPNFSNNCMKMEKFGKRGKHMFKIILCKSATVLCLPMFIFTLYGCLYQLMPFVLVHVFACTQFPLLLFVSFTPACALFISTSLYLHTNKYFGPISFIVCFMSISWSTCTLC